ncbi:Urease operon transcriptional activator [compost metagenome]|uniref:AraC-type DNA-binding protein n=1 Tax=Pseudomonas jinjuensis TaxID=198616 RepID=A0A1H0BG86_9PSED|nr:AraC family transcriptional regulator [Pseudomonas jinjuensis]SDN44677.1 AraC-type DNA-binding protein [Pseudomonas jinjuensis]
MDNASVSMHYVRAIAALLLERSIDPAPLLDSLGIDAGQLHHACARMPTTSFVALWDQASRLLDDEFMGQDRRRMKIGSSEMLCHLLIHCATLGEALQRMAQFFNLQLDDFHCVLESDGPHARLIVTERPGARTPRVLGHEVLLLRQYAIACWLAGRRIALLGVGFAHAHAEYQEEYELLFDADFHFAQPYSSLTFEAACLQLPVVQNSLTLDAFLHDMFDLTLHRYSNGSGLAARIRRRLRTLPYDQWPGFACVAQRLNVSQSTLRRRLEKEGQSFQAIKDDLRKDLAIEQLGCSTRSVGEIAAQLGFAEPSVFHRAFRKWTGTSPGEYRRRLQDDRD